MLLIARGAALVVALILWFLIGMTHLRFGRSVWEAALLAVLLVVSSLIAYLLGEHVLRLLTKRTMK
jgi:uncharacterized membrane protein YfcA